MDSLGYLDLNIPKKPESFFDESPSSNPYFLFEGLICPLSFFLIGFSLKIDDFRLVSEVDGVLEDLFILG